MLSSPFDIIGLLNQWVATEGNSLPKLGVILIGAVLLNAGVKATSKIFTAGMPVSSKESDPPRSDPEGDSSGSGNQDGESEKTAEQQRDQEKEREKDELRHSREQLDKLFELLENSTENHPERPEQQEERAEEQESGELGPERKRLDQLKEMYKELSIEIANLIEKGLNRSQTAKALIARTTEQIPTMELLPLIEAMTCLLKKNGGQEKNTSVIGLDADFERKAALSALKRGEYETVFHFMEHRADELTGKAQASLRSDIRKTALQEAAEIYRAVGILARPVDPERSFEALKKSKRHEPENTLTTALIARAYHESGKKEQAEKLFEKLDGKKEKNDYAVQYASEMMSQIRQEQTMAYARRIREEYENRLSESEERTKAAQNVPPSLKKSKENNSSAARFIFERDDEREIV